MASVNASQLSSLLVKRGILGTHWSDELDKLEEDREKLILEGGIEDSRTRDYITINTGQVDFSRCRDIVKMLCDGKDGEQKTFFTRKYKSNILNRWISILETYETKSLYIAEKVRAIKQQSTEITALRKQISDLGLKLADVHDKVERNAQDISQLRDQLGTLKSELGILGDGNGETEIRSAIEEKWNDLVKTAKVKSESPDFLAVWKEYMTRFPGIESLNHVSDLDRLHLIAEELLAFYKISDSAKVSLIESTRDAIVHALAFNAEAEAAKKIAQVAALKNACEHNKESKRLTDIEQRFRAEIARCEERIYEITMLREILVASLNEDLTSKSMESIQLVD
jgi:predicted RNase H-like nuclease (RuvC/YqgF family)